MVHMVVYSKQYTLESGNLTFVYTMILINIVKQFWKSFGKIKSALLISSLILWSKPQETWLKAKKIKALVYNVFKAGQAVQWWVLE